MDKPENPSAFPLPGWNEDGPGGYGAESGMSLRDWFAGQALAGFCSNQPLLNSTAREGGKASVRPALARAAYALADAMLAERER